MSFKHEHTPWGHSTGKGEHTPWASLRYGESTWLGDTATNRIHAKCPSNFTATDVNSENGSWRVHGSTTDVDQWPANLIKTPEHAQRIYGAWVRLQIGEIKHAGHDVPSLLGSLPEAAE